MKSPADLSSNTLIKRVMSGTSAYRTNDYLEAFGRLSTVDLHHPDYSRFEIIKLWNSLQSTPGRVRYFTFSLVHDNSIVQRLIKENYSSVKYAWIYHDKDSAEHKHYHYLLMFPNPVSFASIANTLELPVTMLQKVFSKRGILDYLTHDNDPNKYHYDDKSIVSNFDVATEKELTSDKDILSIYDDYCLLRSGSITPREFLQKYNVYFATMNISGLLQSFGRLFDGYGTGSSSSSRAQCIVSYPRCVSKSIDFTTYKHSKTPIQTVFPELSESSIPWLESGQKVAFDIPKPPKKKSIGRYRKPNPRSDLS